MLRSPPRPLAEVFAEVTECDVDARHIPAPPPSLRLGLIAHRCAGDVASDAKPPTAVFDRLTDRRGHDPARLVEMAEHRVLVGDVGRRRTVVVAPQHVPLAVDRIDKPVAVLPLVDILQGGQPRVCDSEGIERLDGLNLRRRSVAALCERKKLRGD